MSNSYMGFCICLVIQLNYLIIPQPQRESAKSNKAKTSSGVINHYQEDVAAGVYSNAV